MGLFLGPPIVLTSNPSVGGAAAEALAIPGIKATDTILAVSQKVKGVADLPILAFDTLINNSLTVRWLGDPGPNAVVIVAIKR